MTAGGTSAWCALEYSRYCNRQRLYYADVDFTPKCSMIQPRFLRNAYRKEPISAFLLVMGSVDSAIGGVGGYSGLLFVGLGLMAGGLAYRWLQSQRQRPLPEKVPQYALPPQSSRPLPMLTIGKKQPPQR